VIYHKACQWRPLLSLMGHPGFDINSAAHGSSELAKAGKKIEPPMLRKACTSQAFKTNAVEPIPHRPAAGRVALGEVGGDDLSLQGENATNRQGLQGVVIAGANARTFKKIPRHGARGLGIDDAASYHGTVLTQAV